MTNIPEKHRWLRWLSDPLKRENILTKNAGEGDTAYTLAAHHLSLMSKDQPWIFASNGAASIMIRDYALGRFANAKQKEMIEQLLAIEVHGKMVPMMTLRGWAGAGWATELPCKSCDSDWAKNCPACWGIGTSKGTCNRCDKSHECHCRTCSGEGIVYCPDCADGRGFVRRPGHINNAVIDRAMLARYISGIKSYPGTLVKVMATGKVSPVVVEAEDQAWRIVIMPLRDHETKMGPGLRL